MTADLQFFSHPKSYPLPPRRAGLRIGLLNLMPDKARTVAQLARLLDGRGGTGQVELVACMPDGYLPRSGEWPRDHARWSAVAAAGLDGLIVTGAPFDRLAFEEVRYWPELQEIFDWSAQNLSSTLFLCWAAMAALYHFHAVRPWQVSPKLSGLYRQEVVSASPLVHGLGPSYRAPVSRYALIDPMDLSTAGVQVLARSPATGVSLAQKPLARQVFLLDHLEYGATALQDEYLRDRALDAATPLPLNYFPDDDPTRSPFFDWQPTARHFFANWLSLLRAQADRPLAALR